MLTWRDWQLEVTFVGADGRTMSSVAITCSWDVAEEPFDSFWERCLLADGYTEEVTVFHSMRQWSRFQAIESAIVLGLATVAGFPGLLVAGPPAGVTGRPMTLRSEHGLHR